MMKRNILMTLSVLLGCWCACAAIPSELKATAERGDAAAQYGMGVMYRDGKGVNKDPKAAFEWVKKAAEQGHAPAQVVLGAFYMDGIGVEKNETLGLEWFEKAVRLPDSDAALKSDQAMTLDALHKKAQEGDAHYQYMLGKGLLEGLYGERDVASGVEWLRKAAAQNFAEALFVLGELMLDRVNDGGDLAPKFFSEGMELLARAAAQKHERAEELYKIIKEQVAQKMEQAEAMAHQGNAPVQLELAKAYGDGVLVPKDAAKSMFWLSKAAEQGYARAQTYLALEYVKGEIVPPDDKKAFYWAQKSAAQQDADGLDLVGQFYHLGKGVKQDFKKALEYYRKAAELGQPDGMFNLGVAYYKGDSIEKNEALGLELIKKAAEAGHTEAKAVLEQ